MKSVTFISFIISDPAAGSNENVSMGRFAAGFKGFKGFKGFRR